MHRRPLSPARSTRLARRNEVVDGAQTPAERLLRSLCTARSVRGASWAAVLHACAPRPIARARRGRPAPTPHASLSTRSTGSHWLRKVLFRSIGPPVCIPGFSLGLREVRPVIQPTDACVVGSSARRSWLCCDASALAIASGDARKSLSRSLLFEHSLRGLWRGSCVIRIMSSPSRLRALLGQADGSACCLKFELPQVRAARDARHRRREAFRPSTSSELSPSTSSLYSLSSISSQSAGCILFLPPFLAICLRPREPAPLPSYSRGRPLLRHRRGRQSSLCSFLARCDRKL